MCNAAPCLHRLFAKNDDEDLEIWWHLNDAGVGEDGSVGLAGGGLTSPHIVKIGAGGELEWESKVINIYIYIYMSRLSCAKQPTVDIIVYWSFVSYLSLDVTS